MLIKGSESIDGRRLQMPLYEINSVYNKGRITEASQKVEQAFEKLEKCLVEQSPSLQDSNALRHHSIHTHNSPTRKGLTGQVDQISHAESLYK